LVESELTYQRDQIGVQTLLFTPHELAVFILIVKSTPLKFPGISFRERVRNLYVAQ
jgi:hypothetical protein